MRGLIALIFVALSLAAPAVAQGWTALVIGQTGPGAPTAFADAFHVRNALRDGGIAKVTMLRDQPRDDVRAAVAGLGIETSAAIYVSAPLTKSGDGIVLQDGTLSFEKLIAQVAQAGVTDLALMIETCPASGVSPDLPVTDGAIGLLTALSVGPGETCSENTVRLTEILQRDLAAPLPLDLMLGEAWVSSDVQAPLVLRPASIPATPVVTVLSAQDVSVAEQVVSRAAVSMLAPLSVAPLNASPEPNDQPLAFFPASASSSPAALPTTAGLPEPSIIVGIVSEATRASFSPAVTSGDVTGTEISFDNLTARRNMRQSDPALFATLVESGAFDPPDDTIAVALQTELARMGCYTSTIDGIWGRGSRASVTRYFDERAGVTPVSLDPVATLFRQLILADEVRCAAVDVAATTNSTPAARTTTPRRTAPARQAAPRRQQQPASRTISNSNRLGVFR